MSKNSGNTENDDDFDFMAPPPKAVKRRGPKPRAERVKLIPVSFKVPEDAHARILVQAKRHAKGNLSEWLRRSSTEYEPAGMTEE